MSIYKQNIDSMTWSSMGKANIKYKNSSTKNKLKDWRKIREKDPTICFSDASLIPEKIFFANFLKANKQNRKKSSSSNEN